jgi:CRISPR-associated endonuclease/helicase Cas3
LAELGDDIVLEHHSNLSPKKETTRTRLATENWDAPIVVTTAVQFYESLFAAKTSRNRKLHNIANSVVILDEAQALPVQYLNPCLRSLEQLSSHYHTTTVLCTATQPAVNKSEQFDIGLEHITEIIRDTFSLFASLKRVNVHYRETLDDQTIINELSAAEQALCIVNTRKHAQVLYQLLPESGENYHLSALMCPEHRLQILATVRQRLDDGLATRLISTQLIEAGVDIDFPTVYRSMAGLDSISQAAGRCNRNGKQPSGQVHVFHSEHTASEIYFRETANVGHEILDLYSDDPLSTAAVNAYFDKYYYQQKSKWDAKDIMADFSIVRDAKFAISSRRLEKTKKSILKNLRCTTSNTKKPTKPLTSAIQRKLSVPRKTKPASGCVRTSTTSALSEPSCPQPSTAVKSVAPRNSPLPAQSIPLSPANTPSLVPL